MKLNKVHSAAIKLLISASVLVASASLAFAQEAFLSPGAVFTYEFRSFDMVSNGIPGCNRGFSEFYSTLVTSDPTALVSLRVELFRNSTNELPFWTITADQVNLGASLSVVAGSHTGPGWEDHQGVFRLTYVNGPPAELTYLAFYYNTADCTGYATIAIPEPGALSLFGFGALATLCSIIFKRLRQRAAL